MILGYRLKELRKNNNMSQAQLGLLLGVSKVSISGYENGTRIPSMQILIMILNIFNISADFILGRELNIVCESDNSEITSVAKEDIDIIKEIKSRPSLYNKIAENPKRFFANVDKK